MSKIICIDWDMDGTFCENTELLAFGGVRAAMVAHAPQLENVVPDAMHLTKFAGFRTMEVIEKIMDEPYVKQLNLFSDEKTAQNYRNIVFDQTVDYQMKVMESDAQALQGIEDILAEQEAQNLIVSTSSMPRLLATLVGCEKNGLKYKFKPNEIFSADESIRETLGVKDAIGKPNPTVYLLSQYQTTFQKVKSGEIDRNTPVHVYRIEDSASGVKAAQWARGKTFAKNGQANDDMSIAKLLATPELEAMSLFLDSKGDRDDFVQFMTHQVKPVSIGVTTATHIPLAQKESHGQNLQALQVEHLATSAPELKKYIFG